MAEPSVDNHWQLLIERQVPLKRHVACRVMVSRIAEWWWTSTTNPGSSMVVDWRANGQFRITGVGGDVIQEGIILETRPGWYFYMTDAFHYSGRPAKPSMVGSWSFETTPSEISVYPNGVISTLRVSIRHFCEADYLLSQARGFERGWNDAADRLVKFCEEKPRPT